MKKFLLILALLTLTWSLAAQNGGFVGYKHKGVVYGETLPNGLKDLGGGLLSDGNLGISRYSKGKKQYLWLEKIETRDQKGVPTWVVKDVLEFDSVRKNNDFLYSYGSSCTKNGTASLDLVVMTELSPDKKTYKVLKAWNADVKSGKFRKVATKGIECKVVQE